MKPLSIAATLLVIWLTAAAVSAAETVTVGGVTFARKASAMDRPLPLRGAGILRVMAVVKVYAGALYLPAALPAQRVLEPVAKRLELEYYRAINSAALAEATRAKIEENLSGDARETLAASIDQLAALYRDVDAGDRYALTYVPGTGTTLSLNGEPLGTIPGDEFARAVFAIWLGDRPIDRSFRNRLLGDS